MARPYSNATYFKICPNPLIAFELIRSTPKAVRRFDFILWHYRAWIARPTVHGPLPTPRAVAAATFRGNQREGLAVTSFLRRYRWWLVLLIAFTGLVSESLWLKPDDQSARAKYDQIRFGMTPGEVQLIMGCPPSSLVDTKPFTVETRDTDSHVTYTGNETVRAQIWAGQTSAITVIYQEERCFAKWLGRRDPWWKKTLRGLGKKMVSVSHAAVRHP